MSRKLSRSEALDDISAWNTEKVLCLLRKNGLEECCKAMVKRQIEGDELLHLTDGKLALWKSDLTRPLIGKLWTFVQELNKSPEKYLSDKTVEARQNDDHLSDSGSWGTDFEDETIEPMEEKNCREYVVIKNMQEIVEPSLIKNKQASLQNDKMLINRVPTRPSEKTVVKPEIEETYANCQDEDQNTYANLQETKLSPMKNISKLHSHLEKSLAEKLKEELKRRNDKPTKKPAIGPKPETLPSRKVPTAVSDKKLPQKSFLYNAPKTHQRVSNEQSKTPRRMMIPPPPEPKRNKDYLSLERKKGQSDKELLKPPSATIKNFDLVANLPARTEESEDEYESFDENIIEQVQQKISRVDSKQSLHSTRQGSVESVYKPPEPSDEEEEDYEIYESITEFEAEDNGYLSPIKRSPIPNDVQQGPPPLPSKPSSPSSFSRRSRSEKPEERSPDKKSATLPHASSNTSLANERATRPLPPPPERQSYVDKPWYHNVTREQATTLIKEQGTYSNPQDGYFLLRPSTTNVGNPFVLVLWYKDRVYNIPVRKRSDNRYALGSPKANELSFLTIEEMVALHMKEDLMLHSSGVQIGNTRLTGTPPK